MKSKHSNGVRILDKPVVYPSRLYDHYTASFTTEYDNLLIARIKGLVMNGENQQQLLLDVGTGTGQLLIKLANALADPQIHFVGTDRFGNMVTAARKNISRAGLSKRTMILREDVHKMSFPDGFANIVLSRSTIHHWRNPAQALREIYRVLRPGGVAILHDIRRDAPAELRKAFQLKRSEAGVPAGNFEEKFTPGEVEAILSEALPPGCATITAPTEGVAALGFEVLIRKPENQSVPADQRK